MAILWAVKMTRNVELSTNINSTWEGCYLNALDVLHIDPQFNPCFHTISTRVLMELLAGFSAVILGKIMLLLIGVVKIGRKVALVVCFLVSASCSTAVYFPHDWWTSATLFYILLASYSAANTLFTILVVEMFPTGIRGTASGLVRSFHHLASLLNTRYLWTSCEITLFSTAGMFLEKGDHLAVITKAGLVPGYSQVCLEEKSIKASKVGKNKNGIICADPTMSQAVYPPKLIPHVKRDYLPDSEIELQKTQQGFKQGQTAWLKPY
uniref:Uncharacterized protein n=1 Tax=Timema cristinae TaxID=61476 RepID=A0A7R9DGJ6_TIMCR|nr:unnamed protein product [Timema cristinae]